MATIRHPTLPRHRWLLGSHCPSPTLHFAQIAALREVFPQIDPELAATLLAHTHNNTNAVVDMLLQHPEFIPVLAAVPPPPPLPPPLPTPLPTTAAFAEAPSAEPGQTIPTMAPTQAASATTSPPCAAAVAAGGVSTPPCSLPTAPSPPPVPSLVTPATPPPSSPPPPAAATPPPVPQRRHVPASAEERRDLFMQRKQEMLEQCRRLAAPLPSLCALLSTTPTCTTTIQSCRRARVVFP